MNARHVVEVGVPDDLADNLVNFMPVSVTAFTQRDQFIVLIFPRLGSASIAFMVNVKNHILYIAFFATRVGASKDFPPPPLPARIAQLLGVGHEMPGRRAISTLARSRSAGVASGWCASQLRLASSYTCQRLCR